MILPFIQVLDLVGRNDRVDENCIIRQLLNSNVVVVVVAVLVAIIVVYLAGLFKFCGSLQFQT